MGAQHVFCCTIWSVHGWICHGELLGDIYPATAYSSYNNCAVRAQCEELLYSSATCYKELYPMASKQMLQAKLNQNVKPMYSLSDNPVNCHPPEQEIISRPAWPNSRTLRSVTGICWPFISWSTGECVVTELHCYYYFLLFLVIRMCRAELYYFL